MGNEIIKIKIPATSANIGAGFDCLGLALGLYNEIHAEYNVDKGLIINTDHYIWKNERNIVYSSIIDAFNYAIDAKKDDSNADTVFLEYVKDKSKPLNIKLFQKNNIPIASGLGSSASCIVGGVMIANKLLGGVLTTPEIVNICAKLDGHPDNVTAAVLGGVTASALTDGKVIYSKAHVKDNIKLTVFHPNYQLKTALSRALLPKSYKTDDVIYNIQHSVLTFASLSSGDLEALKNAVGDKLHEPYRSNIITDYQGIKRNALKNGAYAVYISGAGPCIAAFTDDKFDLEAMNIYLDGLNNKWEIMSLDILNDGAAVI